VEERFEIWRLCGSKCTTVSAKGSITQKVALRPLLLLLLLLLLVHRRRRKRQPVVSMSPPPSALTLRLPLHTLLLHWVSPAANCSLLPLQPQRI
jgi:MYXO-CTERM domain-containing protein